MLDVLLSPSYVSVLMEKVNILSCRQIRNKKNCVLIFNSITVNVETLTNNDFLKVSLPADFVLIQVNAGFNLAILHYFLSSL